jgi:hypothetical protein
MAAAALAMQTLDVNGLRMQVAVQGSGPLVLLCHGFPELWVSWRAQLDALAAAGVSGRGAGHARLRRHLCARRCHRLHPVAPGRRHDRPGPRAERDPSRHRRPRLGRTRGLECSVAATRCLPRRCRHERALCTTGARGDALGAEPGGLPRLLPAVFPDTGAGPRPNSSATSAHRYAASTSARRAKGRRSSGDPCSAPSSRTRASWVTWSSHPARRRGGTSPTWVTTSPSSRARGFAAG